MFKLFTGLFIKNHSEVSDPHVRQGYGFLSGALGIICNLILFIIKISVGVMINSVAVISDAFNNFSDMGSTVVSVIGIRLSNKKPDRDHPFGHGRFEYISALIVAFIIMLVGFELLKSSYEKIVEAPQANDINWLMIALLAISIPIKLFMFGANKYWGNAISSPALTAAAIDSRNDCIATSAVIVSQIVDGTHLLPFSIDGYVGALVSLLIMYAGFTVAKDTVGLLLGTAPDEETVKEIRRIILDTPEIMDIHDLIVHDYGPGRLFASVHAEIKDDADIIASHEAIDATEKSVLAATGCELTIHLDPVSVNNGTLNSIRDLVYEVFAEKGLDWSIHDLRMTNGEANANIIFDMVIPFDVKNEDARTVIQTLKERIHAFDNRFSTVIQLDRDFLSGK